MTALWYLLIVFTVFIGDMGLKNVIEKASFRKSAADVREKSVQTEEKYRLPCEILGGRILIRRHHNKGAVLNWGQNRRPVVAVLSIVMSLLMTVVFLFSLGQRGNRLLRLGLSLLLGGAFSNTYDRLKRGYVVDYFSVHVKWKWLENIVFNVSDFCILIGACLLVLRTA